MHSMMNYSVINLVRTMAWSQQIFRVLVLLSLLSCSFGKKRTRPVAYIDPAPRPPMRIIADSFSEKIGQKKLKIIVLTFTEMNGREHDFGTVLSEKLSTELAKKKNIIIFDRLLFQKKLAENNLSLKGGVGLDAMREIGNFLELDAIVTGLVSPYANGLDINCRLIDTKTGRILAAEEAYYSLKFN